MYPLYTQFQFLKILTKGNLLFTFQVWHRQANFLITNILRQVEAGGQLHLKIIEINDALDAFTLVFGNVPRQSLFEIDIREILGVQIVSVKIDHLLIRPLLHHGLDGVQIEGLAGMFVLQVADQRRAQLEDAVAEAARVILVQVPDRVLVALEEVLEFLLADGALAAVHDVLVTHQVRAVRERFRTLQAPVHSLAALVERLVSDEVLLHFELLAAYVALELGGTVRHQVLRQQQFPLVFLVADLARELRLVVVHAVVEQAVPRTEPARAHFAHKFLRRRIVRLPV